MAVILLLMVAPAWAQLTPEQQRAKDKGYILYHMKKNQLAAPYLEVAASAGDAEAQYYMGEIERRKTMFVNANAQRWYERAAQQNYIYAMLRLMNSDHTLCMLMENCAPELKSPNAWADIARSLAEDRAGRGDGEAMFQLYLLTGKFDWLKKSSDIGFPEGVNWLAVEYRDGRGFFWSAGQRKQEVEQLFRKAAEAGYVPAMSNLIDILEVGGNIEELRYWVEVAAKAGHFGAMSNYAAWTGHLPDRVGYPLDLVKAYGLIYLMAQAEPGKHNYGESKLEDLIPLMTSTQIEAGKMFADKWRKAYPPLSRFLPKYGY